MNNLIFKPLFEASSSTWSYILADKTTKEAIIIDPVDKTKDRDIAIIEELGLKLKYILETHIHADHITSAYPLKQKFNTAKIVLGEDNSVDCADILLKDGEKLSFGEFSICGLSTPGHTSGCMSFVMDTRVFTGDTLLIRSCGRCDFQGGSAQQLYHSLQKILALDEALLVYPAHDYSGRTVSSIWEEKQYNDMIGSGVSEVEFVTKVDAMDLSLPKNIHIAVLSNQVCGVKIIANNR